MPHTVDVAPAGPTGPNGPAPAGIHSQRPPHDLIRHLFGFTAALVLPVMVLAGILAWSYTKSEWARLEDDAFRLVRMLTAVLDRELAGTVATAQALATSPALKSGDLAAFYNQADEANLPDNTWIIVHDRTGRQVLNTAFPWGTPLAADTDSSVGPATFADGKPRMSNLRTDAVTKKPVVSIEVPVFHGDQVIYVLQTVITARRLRALFQWDMPPGWSPTVADRDGTVIARAFDHDDLIGTSLPLRLPATWQASLRKDEGMLTDTANFFGRSVFGAFGHVRTAGWLVFVGSSPDVVRAPLYRSLAILSALCVGLLGLSAVLATALGRRITSALAELGRCARALTDGTEVTPRSTAVSDINAVAESLAAASTELRKRGAELQADETRWRALFEQAEVGIVTSDLQTGRMINVNEKMAAMLGCTRADMLGLTFSDITDPEDLGADETLFAELRARRIPSYTIEKRYVRKDETRVWVRVTSSIVEIPSCPYRISIVEDISERREIEIKERETEKELRHLQSELVHVSRVSALGEMASALAHELNQPISAIANYLNGCRRLLAGERDERALIREATENASEQAERAGEIIRGLREFTQPSEVDHRLENLTRLIQEASALGSVGLNKLGIQIVLQLDPQLEVLVNKVQIQQVILNLMRNAIDAMQDSPRQLLIVTTAPAERDMVQVSVADTGPGVPHGIASRLFQPFVTTKRQGTGIGLSICRRIIEAHGGKIWAESNPGGGAIFRFLLRRPEPDEMKLDPAA